MAAMLGVTNADAGLEGSGGFADQSSRVAAVVSRDGIAFNRADVNYWGPGEVEGMFGISSLTDPILAKTSTLTYLSKDSPPFLIFQTASDNTRSGNQELYDKLKAAGASAKFVEITGSDFCAPAGNPSREERAKMIADFFDQNLK
jgi:acetyl esterase/lipase